MAFQAPSCAMMQTTVAKQAYLVSSVVFLAAFMVLAIRSSRSAVLLNAEIHTRPAGGVVSHHASAPAKHLTRAVVHDEARHVKSPIRVKKDDDGLLFIYEEQGFFKPRPAGLSLKSTVEFVAAAAAIKVMSPFLLGAGTVVAGAALARMVYKALPTHHTPASSSRSALVTESGTFYTFTFEQDPGTEMELTHVQEQESLSQQQETGNGLSAVIQKDLYGPSHNSVSTAKQLSADVINMAKGKQLDLVMASLSDGDETV